MIVQRLNGLGLSRWVMRDLSVLNLSDGSMWPELVARRRDRRECTVYLAKRLTLHPRPILGWALAYPTPNLGGHDFHVYIDPEERRQGIGRALYEAAIEDHGVVRTFAPDDTARTFYKAVSA